MALLGKITNIISLTAISVALPAMASANGDGVAGFHSSARVQEVPTEISAAEMQELRERLWAMAGHDVPTDCISFNEAGTCASLASAQ